MGEEKEDGHEMHGSKFYMLCYRNLYKMVISNTEDSGNQTPEGDKFCHKTGYVYMYIYKFSRL